MYLTPKAIRQLARLVEALDFEEDECMRVREEQGEIIVRVWQQLPELRFSEQFGKWVPVTK